MNAGFAADLKFMMDMWNAMESIVDTHYSHLSKEERYQLTRAAMDAKLNQVTIVKEANEVNETGC